VQHLGKVATEVQMISIEDCMIRSLRVKAFEDKTRKKLVSLADFNQLRMLSLANNGLESLDENNGFWPDSKEFHFLDLSYNKLEKIVDSNGKDLLPATIRRLNLEGNPILTLDAFSYPIQFTEVWCKGFMLTKDLQQDDAKELWIHHNQERSLKPFG